MVGQTERIDNNRTTN